MSHKKIHFRLDQDEDGYPPVAVESLWAQPADDGTFVIDNIPFYVRNLSLGDTVHAEMTYGALEYVSTKRTSDNTTIRIAFSKNGEFVRVMTEVEKFGCLYERGKTETLIAVNVPATCKYSALSHFLDLEKESGVLEYEESALRT